MKKKIKSKWRLFDIFIIFFCLSGTLFFAYLFYRDLYSFTVRSDKQAIGVISSSERLIQRKFDDRVVWERVSQNAELYNNDTIRTSDLAHSVLRFKDNTVLNLYENTMIQVSWTQSGGLQIRVNDGGIMVDSSESETEAHVAFDDGSVIQIDAGSSLSAETSAEQNSKNVEIKSGTAQITTEAGDEMALAVGESVNVSKSGRILKNPLTVISPQKELRLLNTDSNDFTNVEFEWKNEYETPVIIQTSRVKNFSKLETDDVVQYDSNFTLEAPSGTLYWRVFTMYTIDSPVSGKIVIDDNTQMHIVSPVSGASFRYFTELPRVKFRWSGNENASHYRLVVSSTRDMNNVVAVREVQDAFLTLDTLQSGTWYWQVTPYYSFNGIGYAGASEIGSFTVVHAEQHSPPELLVPSPNTVISRKDGDSPAVAFSWKSDLPEANHSILIARDEFFDDVVFSENVSGMRFSRNFDAEKFADGTYYWKIVRSATAEDELSESSVRSFRVVRSVPEHNRLLYPPESFSAESAFLASTQFLWKIADEYKNVPSVFQISSTPDFSSILVEKEQNSAFVGGISLPQGTYWWRIGSKSESGEIVELTQERRFSVLKELAVPEITMPRLGQELVVGSSQYVGVSWTAVDGADSYNVKIFDEDDKMVSQRLSVNATAAQFQLVPGKYTVRVQAQADGSEISAARQGSYALCGFSVRGPENIVLESPADKAEIAGLTALRQPTYFSWQIGKDKAGQYTFILQKEQPNGSFLQVDSRTGTGHGVSLRRLSAGNYRWKVQASTAAGLSLDSPEFSFSVTEVPPLENPRLTEPAGALVMGPEYLREHRTIVFRWQSVKNATEYDFSLVKKTPSGEEIVLSKTKMRETQVRLSDLTLLDVGTFVWRVRAYCFARDGFEEQRSPVSESSFSIKFDAPSAVEAVEPGRLYGE